MSLELTNEALFGPFTPQEIEENTKAGHVMAAQIYSDTSALLMSEVAYVLDNLAGIVEQLQAQLLARGTA